MSQPIIPIFYACDDAFVKYTVVSLHSMIQNASPAYQYRVYVLHSNITEPSKQLLLDLQNDQFTVSFEDVTQYLNSIADKLPLRDYYSKTTYFRLFIAEMFPEYDKAIYIDSDTVVQGDISKLFLTDIGDNYVGACHEQAMVQVDAFGTYAEQVTGVSRHNFFNAGLLLINCNMFRLRFVLDKFIDLLHIYNFAVTQDEDYLNVICKDHVYWLDDRWNTEVFGELLHPAQEAYVLHYIMTNKPWLYEDCRHGEIFWHYAKQTAVYEEIYAIQQNYPQEKRIADKASADALVELAIKETAREDNYLKHINQNTRAQDRVAIVEKIKEYEAAGRFDEDVEDDPPGRVLMPEDIDYIHKSLTDKLKTKVAFLIAHKFVDNLMEEKKLIIKEMRGMEHFKGLTSGAIITCNHFNAFDSFAIQLAYEAAEQPNRTFYRVIREGNYTSFPGFYGFLMRHCNTLPLSSNRQTLKKFLEGTGKLLQDGNFVLVYPEQSMWWNYRKPKPLKKGAFSLAAKNNVPVLPCFITMKDSDIMGEDGFYVQEYTIHVAPPIYPDPDKHPTQNTEEMMKANYQIWKEIYETEYQIPLSYQQ